MHLISRLTNSNDSGERFIKVGRRVILQAAGVWLVSTGCTATPYAPNDLDSTYASAIPLGPRPRIKATLTSTEALTTFKISGVGAVTDLELPPTNIVRVVMPLSGITVIAQVPCFPEHVRFIQAGSLADGSEINFFLPNFERIVSCPSVTSRLAPSRTQGDPKNSRRVAWIITCSEYSNDWPQLGFVQADRDNMQTTLRSAGYQILTSSDRSHADLIRDADAFRAMMAAINPEIALVYMSGHGLALNGSNYFVPVDAPDSTNITADNLLPVARIVDDLRPVSERGECAIVLVDACRAESGAHAQPLAAEAHHEVFVNHSAGPGMTSFDGAHGLSAWTEQFILVANSFADAEILQIVAYANRYTRWKSEASTRQQSPVLYGDPPKRSPSFAVRNGNSSTGALPWLNTLSS